MVVTAKAMVRGGNRRKGYEPWYEVGLIVRSP